MATKKAPPPSNLPFGPGFGSPGRGRGRQPGGFGLGPGGECWCPRCNTRVPHGRGAPCYTYKCPKCGSPMTRGR